jgi:DNA replication and repair protein RecF
LAEWEYSGDVLAPAVQRPMLLLDDVMSELDGDRRRALIALVSRGGQSVITTTDLRYFSDKELAGATVVELQAE